MPTANDLASFAIGSGRAWTRRRGIGVRLAVRNELDCTEWAVFESKDEARRYLMDEFGIDPDTGVQLDAPDAPSEGCYSRPMLSTIPDDVLKRHHVFVGSDNAFQRRARLLQALWAREHGLTMGTHRGGPLGSRIEATYARETLANFLTDGIRGVVRHAVLGAGRSSGQLIDEERLLTNLLSSQPLCFNAFGELAQDLDLATKVVSRLMPGRVERVTSIHFEHSPGRGEARFTGDRSAFDVFVSYRSPAGRRGFVGIEVKYHEALGDPAAAHRPRYDEIAGAMGCFKADTARLQASPLQQIWRDHLLAGSLVQDAADFDEGLFVFLCPAENEACMRALTLYRGHLVNDATFQVWTLEAVVDALAAYTSAAWVADLRDRYLGFGRVDACVSGAGGA